MDKNIVLGDLTKPENVKQLQTYLRELYRLSDVIYTTTAPNGNISANRGQKALYYDGACYSVWVNIDGATVWEAICYPKIIVTDLDMTTASGTLTVSGVGFEPKAVICMAIVDGTVAYSWGVAVNDGVGSPKSLIGGYSYGAGQLLYGSSLFYLAVTTGNQQYSEGSVGFNGDGITLSRRKAGTPTGTAKLIFLFF